MNCALTVEREIYEEGQGELTGPFADMLGIFFLFRRILVWGDILWIYCWHIVFCILICEEWIVFWTGYARRRCWVVGARLGAAFRGLSASTSTTNHLYFSLRICFHSTTSQPFVLLIVHHLYFSLGICDCVNATTSTSTTNHLYFSSRIWLDTTTSSGTLTMCEWVDNLFRFSIVQPMHHPVLNACSTFISSFTKSMFLQLQLFL